MLEQRVKRQLLAEVQAICPPGVTIMNVRQGQQLGLGHSILCARPLIGDNPFVVVLPDIILDDASADPLRYNLAAMVARFNETGRSQCWPNGWKEISPSIPLSRLRTLWNRRGRLPESLSSSKNLMNRKP